MVTEGPLLLDLLCHMPERAVLRDKAFAVQLLGLTIEAVPLFETRRSVVLPPVFSCGGDVKFLPMVNLSSFK